MDLMIKDVATGRAHPRQFMRASAALVADGVEVPGVTFAGKSRATHCQNSARAFARATANWKGMALNTYDLPLQLWNPGQGVWR